MSFLTGLRQSGMLLEMPLQPLDAQETAELARVESQVPPDSDNLSDIYKATRGNPLFVVKSVRAGLQSTRGPSRDRGPSGAAFRKRL